MFKRSKSLSSWTRAPTLTSLPNVAATCAAVSPSYHHTPQWQNSINNNNIRCIRSLSQGLFFLLTEFKMFRYHRELWNFYFTLLIYHFTNSVSAFCYSLDVYSLSITGFFKHNTEFKNVWLSLGIETRTTCLMRKCSATELWTPASNQTFQFCIIIYCYWVLLCYCLALNRPHRIFLFPKIRFICEKYFCSANL